MAEILNKRTFNTKFFDGGKACIYSGHVHYKDTNGDFQDVDYTVEDMGTYWRMTKANYRLYVAKDFGASQLIRFDNKFNGQDHTIYYEPHSLRWVNNPDLSDMSVFRTAQAVTGQIVGTNVIRYTDAFGTGIHFEIALLRSGFKKEIVFQSLGSLQNPPTPDHRLVLFSRYQGTDINAQSLKVLARDIDAQDWDGDGWYESEKGFTIEEPDNRAFKSFIRPAYAVDADERQILLKVFWRLYNGALWQAKILPTRTQFLNATYPIRADATTNYYAGAGDGWVRNGDTSWAATYGASAGDSEFSSHTTATFALVNEESGTFTIDRSLLPFDLSALSPSAIISAATLNLYVVSKSDGDNDAQAYIAVVEGFQASTANLVVADFIDCGSDNGTAGRANQTPIEKGSGDEDITGISTGAYLVLSLNATGVGWVDAAKGGWLKLGVREGHDIENTTIANGTENFIFWRPSEYTLTANDPYLGVTYTVPSSIPVIWWNQKLYRN